MELDQDQIKDLSVSAVERFLNEKIPLEDGICKTASELELNSEQIKRVVEASNTIAYLKLQKEAEDKTFEFPVASYEGVMAKMCMPEKQASDVTMTDFVQMHIAGLTKEASAPVVETEPAYEPDEQTKQVLARQALMRNHQSLEKIAVEKAGLAYALVDAAMELRKDEWAIEKLAEVCDEDQFTKLAFLVEGKTDSPVRERVFRDNELNGVRQFLDLYKQAQALMALEGEARGLDKKAFALGSALNRGVNWAASQAGSGVGNAVGAAGRGTVAAGKTVGKALTPANFGKVVGVGLTAGGALLTEPSAKSNIWDNLQGSMKRFK
jgi:hypothetical protein